MKKSNGVAVTAVAALSMVIACGSNDEQARVCVDGSSRVVPPEACETPASYGSGPVFWYYHSGYARAAYPATGTLARSGGTAVTTTGAPVARGGFGATGTGRATAS